MNIANRRDFLRAATAAGTAFVASKGTLGQLSAQSPEARIDVLLNEPIGTIAPEIYGHFVEHLGGCLTPTYHVFDLYSAHQGARSVRTVVSSPETSYNRNGQQAALRGLNGSASLNGSQLTLTVTNPSLDQARETEIVVRGGTVRSAAALMLSERDAHAHNSFEAPRAVEPKTAAITVKGSGTVFSFPPASVTRITFAL